MKKEQIIESIKAPPLQKKKAMLLSALSLAMTILIMGYSAYGWFSMAKDVRAQGAKISVHAQNGLQISLDPTDPTSWTEVVQVDMDDYVTIAGFTPGDDDFFLIPASSYNGFDGKIFTSNDINGFIPDGGDWSESGVVPASTGHYDSVDREYQGYYVDVPLYFRYNYGVTGFDLYMSRDTSSIGPPASRIANTVRIAFLDADDQTMNSMGETALNQNQLVYSNRTTASSTIYDFTAGAVTLMAPRFISFNATSGLSDQQVLRCEPGDESNYTSLVARFWVEGQDTDCVDAIGRQEFNVSLGFHAIPDTQN